LSFTSDQIAALKVAIATGALTVRNANGEAVTYRSLSEMKQVLAMMEAEVAPAASSPIRFINPTYSSGC